MRLSPLAPVGLQVLLVLDPPGDGHEEEDPMDDHEEEDPMDDPEEEDLPKQQVNILLPAWRIFGWCLRTESQCGRKIHKGRSKDTALFLPCSVVSDQIGHEGAQCTGLQETSL